MASLTAFVLCWTALSRRGWQGFAVVSLALQRTAKTRIDGADDVATHTDAVLARIVGLNDITVVVELVVPLALHRPRLQRRDDGAR